MYSFMQSLNKWGALWTAQNTFRIQAVTAQQDVPGHGEVMHSSQPKLLVDQPYCVPWK